MSPREVFHVLGSSLALPHPSPAAAVLSMPEPPPTSSGEEGHQTNTRGESSCFHRREGPVGSKQPVICSETPQTSVGAQKNWVPIFPQKATELAMVVLYLAFGRRLTDVS